MSELGDQLLAVHDGLENARLPHAIGGAIALGYCTLEPRGTRDVDVNVFLGTDRAKQVLSAMPEGVEFSGESLERLERDGQVRLRWGITPVDIFLSVLPFHDQVQSAIRLVPFEGRTIPVLGCTAVAVFKAMFNRPRDWVDIEAMVEARSLDLDEAKRWILEMAGEDERTDKLDVFRSRPPMPNPEPGPKLY